MDEIAFDCSKALSQRFWMVCRSRKRTPGAVLREFMVREIAASDASFEYDLKQVTGQDAWSVANGDASCKR